MGKSCWRTLWFRAFFAAGFFSLAHFSPLRAADLDDARLLFQKADYAGCIKAAQHAVGDSSTRWNDDWPLLLARAQMAVGQYPQAQTTIERALRDFPNSVQIRLEAYYVFRANGQPDRARAALDQIAALLDQLNSANGARLRSMLDRRTSSRWGTRCS